MEQLSGKWALKAPFFIWRFIDDLKVIGRFAPFFMDLKPLLYTSVALGFVSSAVESLAVGLIVLFIFSAISGSFPVFESTGIKGHFLETIQSIIGESSAKIWLFIIAIVVTKSLIQGAYHLLSDHITNTIHHRIRSALFEKYMSLPYKDLAKADYGTMANALQVESWYVAEVVKALSGIVIALCATIVYICVILFLSWPLGVMLLFLGVIIKAVISGLKQPLRHLGFSVTRIHEALSFRMHTRMHALKTFRAHGLEKKETDAFISLSNSVARAFTRMSLVGTYIRPVNDAALLIIIAILIWFSSVIGNPVAITATVIAMLYKLQPYIFSMEGALMTLVKSQGPLDAIIEQLQTKDSYSETAQETTPMPAHWHVLRFHNVCFQYEDEPIINCLSFELPRGKVIAIKGSSGAGKSTLVNLILKLIHPTSGKIWLDDQNFQFIDRRDWLSTVAAAGQDFELLDGTLRANLTFGREASDDELYEALEIAEIKDFIETLPEGLQTRIGDRGVRLSGGQKQRIMLARALVSNPEILIMDEATSAVSLDIEKRIYNNIKNSRPGITLILITHRNISSEFVDVTVEIPSQTHFQAQKSVCNA